MTEGSFILGNDYSENSRGSRYLGILEMPGVPGSHGPCSTKVYLTGSFQDLLRLNDAGVMKVIFKVEHGVVPGVTKYLGRYSQEIPYGGPVPEELEDHNRLSGEVGLREGILEGLAAITVHQTPEGISEVLRRYPSFREDVSKECVCCQI